MRGTPADKAILALLVRFGVAAGCGAHLQELPEDTTRKTGDDPEAAVLDAARRWNAVVALKGRSRSSVLRTAHCGGTRAEISAWRRPDPETCFPDSSPVSPREARRSNRRVRGEWRCMHVPAARWPRASERLAIWRENSPVKCRRSCKLSCAKLDAHDGSKRDWYFHCLSFSLLCEPKNYPSPLSDA